MEDCKRFAFTNEDGTVSVPALPPLVAASDQDERFEGICHAMKEYKWREEDVLLATYSKNGTHFMWEIMMMLMRGSADYIKESKGACMFDIVPITKCDEVFPSPRVLNTHLRLDVLPKEFQRKKTVWVLRNPKDTFLSLYHHLCKAMSKIAPDAAVTHEFVRFTQRDFFEKAFLGKDLMYGNYFDYVDYMWSVRDQPHILLIYFEDLKMNPVETIERVNQFMGLNRSAELVEQIAEATNFSKMKEGKTASMDDFDQQTNAGKFTKGAAEHLYRKGEIGSWREEFTVADNELFDAVLEKWTVSKEIPFKYQ